MSDNQNKNNNETRAWLDYRCHHAGCRILRGARPCDDIVIHTSINHPKLRRRRGKRIPTLQLTASCLARGCYVIKGWRPEADGIQHNHMMVVQPPNDDGYVSQ